MQPRNKPWSNEITLPYRKYQIFKDHTHTHIMNNKNHYLNSYIQHFPTQSTIHISKQPILYWYYMIWNADVNFIPAPRRPRPLAAPRRRKAMKFTSAKKIHWKSHLQTSPASIFHKIFDFGSFRTMTPKLGFTNLRRYAFVWRYDTTNRKPHARKQWEKYGWAKRTRRFREPDCAQ